MEEQTKKLDWGIVGIYTVINIVISTAMIFLLSVFLLKDFVDGSSTMVSSTLISYLIIFVLFFYMIAISKKLTKRYYYYEILLSTVMSILINAFSKLIGFPIIKLTIEGIYNLLIKFVSKNSTASIEEINTFINDSGIYYFHGISIYIIVPILTGILTCAFFLLSSIIKKKKKKNN